MSPSSFFCRLRRQAFETAIIERPATRGREVSHMLKAIHGQETREATDRKPSSVIDVLRQARMGAAAELVESGVQKTLTYYAFPDIHWQKIRTNNPLERIMKEICPVFRMRGRATVVYRWYS